MLYTYKAKDEAGKTVSGQIEANSEIVVAGQLRTMGYFPLHVAQQRSLMPRMSVTALATRSAIAGDISVWNQPEDHWILKKAVYPLWTGVSLPDLAFFYRQLAAMIGAGIPIYRSLTTIEEQLRGGMLKKVIRQISNHVQAGGNITDAMAQFPYLFSDLHCAMVAVAEKTGGVDIMLTRLADYLEREYALRQMIKRETFYPKTVLVLSLLLPPLYLFFLNQASAYFQTAVLPLLYILGAIALGYVTGRYALRSGTLSVIYDTIKAHLPYFGNTTRMLALAKFSRALAALYSAGVSVPSGLETAARVSGNAYLGQGMHRAADSIVAGETITDAFKKAKVFPPMVISMVSSGETTGSMDIMLEKVADYYEGDAAARLHKSATMLGVLVLLVAAVVVGIVVIHFYTGYFGNMMNAVGSDDGP